jgi:hypothetical protein
MISAEFTEALAVLIEECNISNKDALMLFCDLVGTIVKSMSADDEDLEEGLEFCNNLIRVASEQLDEHQVPDPIH